MTTVVVQSGAAPYNARIGAGLIREIRELLPRGFGESRCAIIADEKVAGLLAAPLRSSLAACTPIVVPVPSGEESKTLAHAGIICEQMAATGLDRSSFVIAVGGGVVGDLAGFVAAIYHRGIPWVNVPTTLLAMVDASIGGKTGVNTATGKNLIGAFHHPSLVIADFDTLATLPPREFKQGFAEIIKHGIIRDAAMLDDLRGLAASSRAERSGVEGPGGHIDSDATGSLDFTRDDGRFERLIARNIEIKAAIVAADDLDVSGERAVLNFGHTVGHAIERAAGYGTLWHGEAISLGIVAACRVSMKSVGLASAQFDEVISLLRSFDLPTTLPIEIDRGQILEAVRFDKKFEAGRVRFVVTPKLGEAHLSSEITLDDIRDAIAQL